MYGTAWRFQLTAARRRLVDADQIVDMLKAVSTHSRPKAAGSTRVIRGLIADVSTHSRPKAAGVSVLLILLTIAGFNSQPPEGGWFLTASMRFAFCCFNSQPPEGGWSGIASVGVAIDLFQLTAARRRLGYFNQTAFPVCYVSTHSRPKAAGNVFIATV